MSFRNINTGKLVRFSRRITIAGILTVTAIWLFGFLFLPLAILWIGPFFAIASFVGSIWAYFKAENSVEKQQAKKNFVLILAFYVVFLGGGFIILEVFMRSLFF